MPVTTIKKIPFEQISFSISKKEKDELQRLADEKGKSLNEIIALAVRAYLYAIRHKKKIELRRKNEK